MERRAHRGRAASRARAAHVADNEIAHVDVAELAARLASLPAGEATRISVGRYRGPYEHSDQCYPEIIELGGFHVGGPCTVDEIVHRYGADDYRVTAYGYEPSGLLWECIVENLRKP